MTHGDDYGLIIPPKVAPIKIVIVPIYNKKNKEKIIEYAQTIKKEIKIVDHDEIVIDKREETPGSKYYFWELKGVPLRIEIGEREMEENRLTIFRRDVREKEIIKREEMNEKIKQIFEEIHKNLYKRALKELREAIVPVNSLEELKNVIKERKAGIAYWCGKKEEEDEIKYQTGGAKSINSPLKGEIERLGIKKPKGNKCFICGKETQTIFIFGKSI